MILSEEDLAAVRAKAEKCHDPLRPTRCSQCTTILTLLAHIKLSAAASESRATLLSDRLEKMGELVDQLNEELLDERSARASDTAIYESTVQSWHDRAMKLEAIHRDFPPSSCLTCGLERPFALRHAPSGVGVCTTCHEALDRVTLMERERERDALVIGADRMAGEIAEYVRRGVLDSRSGPADALLDYATTRYGQENPIGEVEARFAALLADRAARSSPPAPTPTELERYARCGDQFRRTGKHLPDCPVGDEPAASSSGTPQTPGTERTDR